MRVKVHNRLQGRVSEVFRLLGFGSLPVGSALAGIVAETLGLPAVFAICAALTLLLLIPFAQVITPHVLNARLAALRKL